MSNSDQYKFRNDLLRQYVYLAFFVAIPLAPIEYLSGMRELAITLWVFAAAVFPLLRRIRNSSHYTFHSRYFMVAISCLFVAGFLFSSLEADNKYFLLLYPIAAFSIRGVREGVWWSAALVLGLIALYFLVPERHSIFSLIYFFIAFLMVGYIVFQYRYYEILNFEHIHEIQKQKDRLISEKDRQARELEDRSHTDFLTGLYNRHKLNRVLADEVENNRRSGSGFGVILLDVDDFKQVNDSFGHQAGDTVLRELAALLSSNVRGTDAVGRWGGEEFIVIARTEEPAGLLELAEKLRRLIEAQDFAVVGSVTASLGVAIYEPGESIPAMIARSDEALYRAKRGGRNRVENGLPEPRTAGT